MIMSLDIRLLKWLLYGPDKAHWSDADLGSHLRYERVGSVYKRGLFYCWNHFCAVTQLVRMYKQILEFLTSQDDGEIKRGIDLVKILK